jgi:hypothetical protein
MQGVRVNRSFYSPSHILRPAFIFLVLYMAQPATTQPAVMLEKAIDNFRRVQTFSCSIIRKQSYNGFKKTAQCEFHYSRKQGKFTYVYASPFDYSFWIDDSTVCGVKRGGNRGYRIAGAIDSVKYRALLESIHLCRPLFQFAAIDTLRVSLIASIDDSLYFQYPAGGGREVVKVDKGRNVVTLMETFDSAGVLRKQTLFTYETKKGKTSPFPSHIITRGNAAGDIETDTLLLAKVEVNKSIKESVFTPPVFADVLMR